MGFFGSRFGSLFGSGSGKEKGSDPELETAFKAFKAQPDQHARQAFVPVTELREARADAASKFGGAPYLHHPSDWPACPNCGQRMPLFLQLDRRDLPAHRAETLFQMFYCTTKTPHCESLCDAWAPFSRSVVCRHFPVPKAGGTAVSDPPPGPCLPERLITGWEPRTDLPSWEDIKMLGLEAKLDYMEWLEEFPLEGDKLGGWPRWVQGAERPSDPASGSRMELFFQLDSEVNLDYMFGDAGIGHVTESRTTSYSWNGNAVDIECLATGFDHFR